MSSKNIRNDEPSNEDEALLSSVGKTSSENDSEQDLLDGIDGSSAPAWRPEEEGEGVVGTVLQVSSVQSDFSDAQGNKPMCPVVTVRTRDGNQHRIVGYQAVLRRELDEKNPQVGQVLAVKYLGRKSTQDGKRSYANYGVDTAPSKD